MTTHPTLKLGSTGAAVTRAKKLVNQDLGTTANTTPVFGPFFRTLVKRVQKKHGIPQTGWIGPATWEALAPPLPPLVKPKQGFESLTDDLWRNYTEGRNMGLSDLGTWNPDSKLPSGNPSDHATSRLDGKICEPACAFDLGFVPATGQNHPVARSFFNSMIGRPEVNYVILGTLIWSREHGLHAYTAGGHDGHVHVSGHRR